jgi:hypothetical protein
MRVTLFEYGAAMFDPIDADPISPSLHALLDLFSAELDGVAFPELDRGVLEVTAQTVRERAEALAQAQAALDAARAALLEGQETLLSKGQRALAYARIYAEEHPELLARLDGIQLPKTARRGPGREGAPPATVNAADGTAMPKRRGRPPKVKHPSAPLFAEASGPTGTTPPAAELETTPPEPVVEVDVAA